MERVIDRYLGEVAMLGDGTVVRVDQAHLETVIPAPGGAVLVVNGQHRGCRWEERGLGLGLGTGTGAAAGAGHLRFVPLHMAPAKTPWPDTHIAPLLPAPFPPISRHRRLPFPGLIMNVPPPPSPSSLLPPSPAT